MGEWKHFLAEEYYRVKAQHQGAGAVIFWRVGDFYETYFDDATTTAKIFTGGKTEGGRPTEFGHTVSGGVPMTCVPVPLVSITLARMVKAGCRVAVCESVVTPAGGRWGNRYEVVRVVSPGLDHGEREFASAPPVLKTEGEDTVDRMNRKLDRLDRLLAEKAGQKWRPSLSVIPGGGKGRKKKAKRPDMTLLDGGRG